jgi:7,8-dihydroneopterin aldolase/epimerase/oxygenase
MRTVGIQNAEFFAYHGYYEQERTIGQLFDVSVSLTFDPRGDAENLSNTLNYEELYTILQHEMNDTKHLLESVVEAIISKCRSRWPFILSGKVVIRKPGAQLGGKIGASFVAQDF